MKMKLTLLLASTFCVILNAQTFIIVEGSFTWQEAKADAESRGGTLAVLDTQQKIDAANTYLQGLGTWPVLWIGGTDEVVEGDWKWINGQDVDSPPWGDNEPGGSGEDYLAIWNSGASLALPLSWSDWSGGLDSSNGGSTGAYLLETLLTFTLNDDSTEYSVSGYIGNPSGSLDIPSTYGGLPVTSIGERAFESCEDLSSITIPNSVTSIEYFAFYRCLSLTNITIPNSVTSIGDLAFRECTSLASITIPDSVTSIGDNAFAGCTSLSSITIGNSVTSIGNSAFSQCTSLTSITIPNSVTSIGNSAFAGCRSLTSIIIGDSVTSIGERVFQSCEDLSSITIDDSVTSIASPKTAVLVALVLLEAAKAERDARLTMDEVREARVGSTMIEVSGAKADITMTLEETSDLNDWSSAETSDKTIQVDAPAGIRFYRFKMSE